jgi:hypothetical protein
MGNLTWLLTGGFAKGYRTYVLAGLAAVTVVANWSLGDQTTNDSVQALWQLLMSLSFGAARAALPK